MSHRLIRWPWTSRTTETIGGLRKIDFQGIGTTSINIWDRFWSWAGVCCECSRWVWIWMKTNSTTLQRDPTQYWRWPITPESWLEQRSPRRYAHILTSSCWLSCCKTPYPRSRSCRILDSGSRRSRFLARSSWISAIPCQCWRTVFLCRRCIECWIPHDERGTRCRFSWVVSNSVGKYGSHAYGTSANQEAVIKALDKFVTSENPARFQPMTSGEYIRRSLQLVYSKPHTELIHETIEIQAQGWLMTWWRYRDSGMMISWRTHFFPVQYFLSVFSCVSVSVSTVRWRESQRSRTFPVKHLIWQRWWRARKCLHQNMPEMSLSTYDRPV